jgi:hypothetical protein
MLMWTLKADRHATVETLSWLKSMRGKLAVTFEETGTTSIGPQGQMLRGLRLIVRIVEDSPELREELDRMGFEATDE